MVVDLESIRIFRASVTGDLCVLSKEPRLVTFWAQTSPWMSARQSVCKWHCWQPVCVFKLCVQSGRTCRCTGVACSEQSALNPPIFSRRKQKKQVWNRLEKEADMAGINYSVVGWLRCCFINPNELKHLSARGMWSSLPFFSPVHLCPSSWLPSCWQHFLSSPAGALFLCVPPREWGLVVLRA